MLRRFRIWIRRVSIASMVLFLGLECLAFSWRGMHVIGTTGTSQRAFGVSPVWFRLVNVEDPSGEAIPFFKADGMWSDKIVQPPGSRTRSGVMPFYFRDSAVYRTRQGGWLLVDGWAFGYAI